MIQLLTLLHELAEAVDKGGQIELVILDFFEALDRVLHWRLPGKHDRYGIWGQAHGS